MKPNTLANFDNVKPGTTSDKLLNQTIKYDPSWNTVQACLYDLARICQCRFMHGAPIGLDSGDTFDQVIFYPLLLDATATVDFTLAMFGYAKGVLGGAVYPILSCSSSTTAMYLPGIRKIILTEIDELKKKHAATTVSIDGKPSTGAGALIEKAVAAATPLNGPAGASVGMQAGQPFYPDPRIDTLENFIRRSGDPADPTAVQQAQAAFNAATRAMGVALTVETIGIPNVYPGMIAAVQGLGIRLSTTAQGSTYSIRKVTHTLNASGFSTTLEMTSNVGSFISKQISINASTGGATPQSGTAPTDDSSGDNTK